MASLRSLAGMIRSRLTPALRSRSGNDGQPSLLASVTYPSYMPIACSAGVFAVIYWVGVAVSNTERREAELAATVERLQAELAASAGRSDA